MAKKTRKKLNPKNYTTAEHTKACGEAMANGEIAAGEYLPELKPKAPKK